ncbi:methyl-accepting chemotaxis protein 4 [Desulfosporosinus acididurans]|uniref:Methyl-accepting chemotaxis protein 4 n=1 Tax=Desulfosporosinus acididurans TaxID=476652 RepID=A0A0J1FQN1_9FIRM|nr:methyl-accepting chemotaxis protein [Desulfosporosinus acididurans]KLU65283.1 methyl-accepting chemotaxis protein 4 [Desulfosporosinus acididurans]
MLKRPKLNRSILVLIIVSVLVALGVGTINIYKTEANSKQSMDLYTKTLNESYDQNIRFVTQQAISTLNGIYTQEQQGKLTEAQAKQLAATVMTKVRYGDTNQGYFWGDTIDGLCVFHGTDQSLVGTNRNNAQDSKGDYYIQEIRKAAVAGGGYINFWFPKADPNDKTQYPKRGYALEFKPWQWIIGTGNYVDDIQRTIVQRQAAVDQENRVSIAYTIAGMLLVILVSVGFSLLVNRRLTKQLEPMAETAIEVAKGNLNVPEIKAEGDDAIGHLGKSLNTMAKQLRDLVQRVSLSSEQVASTSNELSSGAEQSAQASNQITMAITEVFHGTEKQLATVENSRNIVTTIMDGIKKILSSSQGVVSTSEKAAEAALQGSKAIEQTIEQMNIIEKIVGVSAEVIQELGDESKEISQIVDMISNIASQTNLLALNAAIEAAQAGEQGRGFAVVADEVKKLAEQSGQAVQQIAELISSVQSNTQKAVTTMGQGTKEVSIGMDVVRSAGQTFNEISELVNSTLLEIRGISEEIKHTASGSNQIVDAIQELDEASLIIVNQTQTVSASTQEQAASIEEIATGSKVLSDMAQELKAATEMFQLA